MRKQRVIVAGLGFMGEIHVQAYAGIPAAEVVAIVESRHSMAKEKLERLGLDVPIFTNLAEALLGIEADIVDVCLPTDRHADAAVCALEHSKHLFCEKPVAVSLLEAERIRSAAEEAGTFCQVGHCIRFWPEYQALEQTVRSGSMGALRSLSLQRRAALPDYSADDWLRSPERSLGAAVDLHIHDTDYVLHLLGMPDAVFSSGTKDRAGWSHIFTQYLFDDYVVVAEGGWNYPAKWGFQMAFQAVLEGGTIEFDSRAAQPLMITRGGHDPQPLPTLSPQKEASEVTGNISSLGGYANELEYFIGCVSRKEAPGIATLKDGIQSLRVVLCELDSAERKAIVQTR